MLNIFWRYWKNKDVVTVVVGQTFLSASSAFLMYGMSIVMVCGWLLISAQPALATPPLYPGMGGGHKDAVAPMHHRTTEGKGRLLAPGDQEGIGGTVYTTGTVSVIALLVDFSDVKFTKNRAYFQELMNNFAKYYKENSYGKIAITYQIATSTSLSNTMQYYASRENQLIEDAVNAANKNVDFSKYDALMVIHAGQGYESSGNFGDIQSMFVYSSFPGIVGADNTIIYGACIVSEHEGNASSFGIFCHEFGHQLGLPDLYNTDNDSAGIGNWSLMATGAWNGSPQGSSPAHFDAWCKVELDWITPQTVPTSLIQQSIPQAETNPVAYKLWNNTMDTKEYFLVENRQSAYLLGKGLLIYHVDENQQNNNNQSHYMVALEQADGRLELEHKTNNRGDAGDPYPGNTSNKYFDDLSNPNSRTYSGKHTYIAVKNISNSDSTMTADLSVFPLNINLTSPNNDSMLSTNTPTFAWTSVEGVGTYTLTVGTRTFSVATTTTGTILYRPALPLEENAYYPWSVTAGTKKGTYTSETWYFWINVVNSPPSVPILSFPINGQTISQQTPTFRWQASTDPDPKDEVRYALMYWTGSGTKTSGGTITSNSWTPPQNLSEGSYSWNVVAVDTIGITTWSGTETFTIQMITENGGTITGKDGTTTVIFPEGAVHGIVMFDIFMPDKIDANVQQVIDAAANVSIATNTIRQMQVTSGQIVFAKPVTIYIPYSGTTTTLQAIYALSPYGIWERIENSSINTTTQTISAQVYFFSVFGIGAAADYCPSTNIISSVANWPNPFIGGKESTTIYYILKDNAAISINIYNPIGELVWNTQYPANSNGGRQGVNEITWDGKNGEGERVSQGIYFCVIEANGSRKIRKIGVK